MWIGDLAEENLNMSEYEDAKRDLNFVISQ